MILWKCLRHMKNLIKGVSKIIQNEAKEQKKKYFLETSKGTIREGEQTVRAGQDF